MCTRSTLALAEETWALRALFWGGLCRLLCPRAISELPPVEKGVSIDAAQVRSRRCHAPVAHAATHPIRVMMQSQRMASGRTSRATLALQPAARRRCLSLLLSGL